MAADLKRLVAIARISTAAKPTSSTAPGSDKAEKAGDTEGDSSPEIARLVARINQNYSRDTPEFHWPEEVDTFLADDSSIVKEHSITLEKDFTLVEHYRLCSIISPDWRFADNRIPADYRMSADSVADCDKQRYGLEWKEIAIQTPLAQIGLSPIELSEPNTGDSRSDPILSFRNGSTPFGDPIIRRIHCKNRSACEQMAADLKRLVEIARKSATPKKALAQ